MKTLRRALTLLLLVTVLAAPVAADAQRQAITMSEGETLVMQFPGINRIAVGNPAVADVVTFPDRSDEILINAKTAGVTTFSVWSGPLDEMQSYTVSISSQATLLNRESYQFRHYNFTYTEQKVNDTYTEVITRVDEAKIKHVAAMLTPILGAEHVSIDGMSNRVAMMGTPQELAIAHNMLDELDTPRRQVVIEARVIEISKGDIKRLGNILLAQQGRYSANMDLNSDTGDALSFVFDTFNDLTDRFSINLNTLQSNNIGDTLVNSKVAVLDGNTAWILSGESLPIASRDNERGLVSYTYMNTGIILTVVPRVGEDETITLWVKPEVSNVVGWVGDPNSSSETAAPIINTREVLSEIRLEDGETVFLGGLTNEETTTETKKVPLLGDLPAVGSLFRSKRTSVSKSELVISLTPHIMKPGEKIAAAEKRYIDLSASPEPDADLDAALPVPVMAETATSD
jgi:type II secretory pathway component GspD/PulD (secretin)